MACVSSRSSLGEFCHHQVGLRNQSVLQVCHCLLISLIKIVQESLNFLHLSAFALFGFPCSHSYFSLFYRFVVAY